MRYTLYFLLVETDHIWAICQKTKNDKRYLKPPCRWWPHSALLVLPPINWHKKWRIRRLADAISGLWCRRLCQRFYEVEFKPLAAQERTRDDTHYPITEAYVKAAEEAIREPPETLLWSHRHWKCMRPSDVGQVLAESSSLEVE